MEFNLRPLDPSDYEGVLVGWWKDWGFIPPSRDFLPEDGAGGVMVLDGDEPVCAGFMYATNSKVAWVNWIVSSKTYRKKPNRSRAITLLVETLTNIAKNTGHKYVYVLIKNNNLINTYEKVGYVNSCSYTNEMIKIL